MGVVPLIRYDFILALSPCGLLHPLIERLLDRLVHQVYRLEAAGEAEAEGRADRQHEGPHPDSAMAVGYVLDRLLVNLLVYDYFFRYFKNGQLLVLQALP